MWEAAHAFSAAPTFFKQIALGEQGSSQPYVDGGMGRSNSITQILGDKEYDHLYLACPRMYCTVRQTRHDVSARRGEGLEAEVQQSVSLHRVGKTEHSNAACQGTTAANPANTLNLARVESAFEHVSGLLFMGCNVPREVKTLANSVRMTIIGSKRWH
jgi:hypothetical protein